MNKLPIHNKRFRFWRRGEPLVWACGAALAATLAMTFGLLGIVLYNGLGVFWPHAVAELRMTDGQKALGEIVQTETDPHTGDSRLKIRVGNAEDGPAFRWIDRKTIAEITYPADAFVLERRTNLNYYGFLKRIEGQTKTTTDSSALATQLASALATAYADFDKEIAPLVLKRQASSRTLKDDVKYALISAEYRRQKLLAGGAKADSPEVVSTDKRLAELRNSEKELKADADLVSAQIAEQETALRRQSAVFADMQGREKTIALVDVVRFYCPNQMGFFAKLSHYAAKVWELVSADPRESNQDGGVFPALFGTVLMVFLMAVLCFPLGVTAGVYLGEYAKDGLLVRLVRVAVNNLAGIPSIVYGIFGLGFFIYLIGGQMDSWLYPDRIAVGEPVFGQGCILWASLTLGLLTIPVVIVSTEEALRAIPRAVAENSYALGATKFQTLMRTLLPMASPGMMTGFILAMARAAGEVAPLMLTGAVKNAPVPFDSSFPFLHLDRQFMHLGFHILDISCKSPNVEATKPMVYVTTLLLLLIVTLMSGLAIALRNNMQKRYQSRGM